MKPRRCSRARGPLMPLEPQGRGSGDIECLSSYIRRLAAANGVYAWWLCDWIRVAYRNKAPAIKAHVGLSTVNGSGPRVQEIVDGLAASGAVAHAERTTLIPWRPWVCHNLIGTFKQTAAYCPSCIQDDVDAGRVPYIRLAWLIGEVKACAHHRTKLVCKCPKCGVALRRDTRLPDHLVCTVCRTSAVEQPAAHLLEEATYSEVWIASAVSDLIAATHGGSGILTRENFEDAVRFITHNYFGGRLYNLERKLVISRGTLRRWLVQPAKPQLTTVLRMFEAARLSPVDLLFTRNGALDFGDREYRMEHYTARKKRPMTSERRAEIERRMRTALETPGTGQIARICKDLRMGAGTIQRHLPELYRSLRAKGLQELKTKHARAKESRLRRVMEGAQLLVSRGIYPSQRQLRRHCGVTATDLALDFVRSEFRAYQESLSGMSLREQ